MSADQEVKLLRDELYEVQRRIVQLERRVNILETTEHNLDDPSLYAVDE